MAPRPTPNRCCHKGPMTPGYPKMKAPGQKIAAELPITARMPWAFFIRPLPSPESQ